MQAVRRRVEQAVRQTKRRQVIKKNRIKHDYGRQRKMEGDMVKGMAVRQIREAHRMRKEDYELGPIAPRRDAGKDAEHYGTIDNQRFNSITVPPWKRKWCPIEVGDRVIMLKGVDAGKIGVVDDKDLESEQLRIKDLNMASIHLPEWLRSAQGHNNPTGDFPMNISWHDVRLVHPLPHPITGVERDVIVENLERREVYTDDETLETEYERVIPELDYVVPWPKKHEVVHEDHDSDTLRITVEQRTWLPTINEDPFPPSVIDELRNKYSKYRVPDNENFAKRRMAHEENKKTRDIKWMESMRTPLQELHALRAEERRKELREKGLEAPMPEIELKRGKPWKWKARPREQEPVDDEFLARIGSMLAEKKAAGSGTAPAERQKVKA
ncbi:hypothetical protein NA57DRAFT_54665 [Rhizodiscina lignyota]|uniref:KOW domain-containing protein n=1 Tax=Rhizodiscina lignyota TaxID=1504668 RepID=A0A9P4M7D8_9PEZI|nr:hypothetical protein NA57DRAFT_54665 [Rhizodiscina lignyota]